ncbi:MAG: cation:proton antiporter [Rhodospirillales bacterium]|nr:cation:proton antiporter [Rhodospirillales bacterium]
MIASIAEFLILGFIVDWAFRKMNIPGLVGLLLLGVVLGPYVLGWATPELLRVSDELRLIALIVILLRAGFEISKETLNRVGGRVLILATVPAVFEGVTVMLLGPWLLGLGLLDSAVLGAVLAAISPAVVVPLMIRFIERGMGAEKGIPTMIIASATINDVFVIVIFSVLVGIYTGTSVNIAWQLAGIPISILLGLAAGWVIGIGLFKVFDHFNPRATKRVLVLLGLSVLLVRAEHLMQPWVPFAALLAVVAIGFYLLEKDEHMAHQLSAKLAKVWILAEIVLFTMIGTQVNIEVAFNSGMSGAALIGVGLLARGAGTYLSMLGSSLNFSERIFVAISSVPKATVQAAIGGVALVAMMAAGMAPGPGEVILAVAVLSIVLTAPLGAWAISVVGDKVLQVAPAQFHDARDAVLESKGSDDAL